MPVATTQLHLEVEGGEMGPDSQLLFITSTCVTYCVLDFPWSPQPSGPPTFPEEKFLTAAR